MLIANIVTHEAIKMSFIEDDHMIRQVPPTTTNPALRYSVLPRTSQGVRIAGGAPGFRG
jgi:hypothetical protein